ncbi:MAG TPA: lysylphosphatidylglycerol synthase transmembrane domain-containing protein [Thermoanaerobaculia bacterium]|nr:lysylphosphatidylglycerol synthase transmembrane domain-containing protein [Thermoanaerobaculia bacterium]
MSEGMIGRRARLLLRLAVSAILIAWILRRAPLAEVFAAFRDADLRWIAVSLLLNPLGYWASVSRWRLLLRAQGHEVPFGSLVRTFLAGVFFNNFLPSTIGGDAVRAVDTARAGVGRGTAVAVVLIDRFLGLLVLLVFAGIGVLAGGPLVERAPALYLWVAAGAAAAALAAWLLFVPPGRAAEALDRVGRRLPGRLAGLFARASDALFAFRGRGAVQAGALVWSVFLQGLVVANVYCLARALHIELPFATFILLVPLVLLVSMLPVSINAIGVRENAWAFVLAAYGVASASAVALAWLDYGLVLAQALVGGAVYAWGRREAEPAGRASEALP